MIMCYTLFVILEPSGPPWSSSTLLFPPGVFVPTTEINMDPNMEPHGTVRHVVVPIELLASFTNIV